LKDDHRHDLHQIMAYSSFSKTDEKFSFLCYPSDNIEYKILKYKNGLNEVSNSIIIFGIPLKKGHLNDTKKLLLKVMDDIYFQSTTQSISK
jgi:5-methylcytosine-specific restriction endonuclease McrBC regulatory subunit McrC